MGKVNFNDHPIFKNINAKTNGPNDDGLNFRCDKNKPIGENETFQRLGLYIDKIINDQKLLLRRKDLRGSYTWQASDTRLGGNTLIKLCHYDIDDYFFGIREDWAQLNNAWQEIILLCFYRFVVPPKTAVKFIGFPCLDSDDLDKIKEIIELIPLMPKFTIR